jgi:ComF family protein
MLAQIAREAERASRSLLNLLYPPRCVICHREGEWFCVACRAQAEFIPVPICQQCGRPLHGPTCPFCMASPLEIDGLRAVTFFDGVMRKAIHCFKYQRRPELALQFGCMLGDYLAAQRLPIDVLVPVPLHRERERWRGYNQALLLARETALQQKLALWYNVVERTRDTPPQVELDARTRRGNVRDAFMASEQVAGTRVLLIDDVCTTGATMEACAVALKRRGAASVWGLALARPRFADEFRTRR